MESGPVEPGELTASEQVDEVKEPDANEDDQQSRSQGRAALLGAITGLLAVLTAVGAANGVVAKMFRNHPVATIAALALELTAILCGLLTQVGLKKGWTTWLLGIGSVALVLGMLSALVAEVKTLSLGDRPTITASVQLSDTNVLFRAHVEADGAKARDQVVVTVFGLALDGSRTASIYYSKTGPDASGDLVQDVQIAVDATRYRGVYLTALVVSEHRRPPQVDCDGDTVGPDGQNIKATPAGGGSPADVPFRPGGTNPVVACTVVEFPVALAS